ncbi:type I-E CRISPR-associated protein Cas5/CasD [Solwaraspora sp. WMMD406]|uniref:type I-E CRISPR-associated protein Cas5/CasD n=1 Tax=Solwaraspora sp. WMMD406 TaxID=3016095 RepID=UPI002417D7F5|nr:type I-E CRISPR-associated protein Cas5/CasD [Solwaraspora sp. WMMD406]MDG4768625.1 type I-E CRISPR-associated protein Cas5/CasD [Solwaraspora sp. WMMD406]
MTGLLLRLAGPMQSWGDHSTFSVRDTATVPTRSAMTGLIAAALGRRRGEPIDDLAATHFTIRVDRPGTLMYDFHTVGGGLPTDRTVPTAEGKRRQPGTATIVSRRYYLADAVFTVAVTGPDTLITRIHEALTNPVWAPYLGRRSCPVEHPFLLTGPISDAADRLDDLPLHRRRPADDEATVPVDFVTETPGGDGAASRMTLNDVPVDLHPHRRRYLTRQVHITTRALPADLCAGTGAHYLDALDAYLQGAGT